MDSDSSSNAATGMTAAASEPKNAPGTDCRVSAGR